jgi:two-component system response regulator MtrA
MSAVNKSLVVLADDDPDIRMLIERILELEGCAILPAGDGAAALALIREHAPALAVIDVAMPVMSGIEVAEQVRADGSKVPILMLSARAQQSDVAAGLASGADFYLCKPFTAEELRQSVQSLLSGGARSGDGT